MKKMFSLLVVLMMGSAGFSQMWIDTVYTIQTDTNIQYGTAIDFAGTARVLEMDISYPTNDVPPVDGRPLMVLVHGGAWLNGDKADGNIGRMREDFAKRGYTTASVNYRLGQFHTNAHVNCNIDTLFDIPWNCLNMTDTSEWNRANFRGIQDVNGAIRYLVNNAASYDIDPNNVFVVGESAGGFIAIGVGYMDDPSEVQGIMGAMPDAPAPNNLYESRCIQGYDLATDIASMDLSRPDLGSYAGTLNLPLARPYTIRGVGSFYGGAFNEIFSTHSGESPILYMFHQPCDLIVPYNRTKLLSGYQDCFYGWPASCGFIFKRAPVWGSFGIKLILDDMMAAGDTVNYMLDNTNNQWICFQQASPGQNCHAIDNYWLRTTNMATFFQPEIISSTTPETAGNFRVYPNPSNGLFHVEFQEQIRKGRVQILDLQGRTHAEMAFQEEKELAIDTGTLSAGIYFLRIIIGGQAYNHKIILR